MNEQSLLREIEQTTHAIRAYEGTDCFNHFCALLDALEESYKVALVHVSEKELPLLQGATRQVIAMRRSIKAPLAEGHTPRI